MLDSKTCQNIIVALYPSKVGTPSCLPACRLEPWRLPGCLALYRCRDALSLSRLFSVTRLSSIPGPAPKSKRSSKTPKANWPYPEGNVNTCCSAFWEEQEMKTHRMKREKMYSLWQRTVKLCDFLTVRYLWSIQSTSGNDNFVDCTNSTIIAKVLCLEKVFPQYTSKNKNVTHLCKI